MRLVSPAFQRRLLVSAEIDAADAQALVEAARALRRRGAQRGTPLRGRNIALLCSRGGGEGARRFDAAASALGARVAHIQPAPGWLQADAPIGDQTARVLESLYDAVDCEDMPAGFAQRLQAQLGVPVYDGLARADHPIARLLPRLAEGDHEPDDEDWCALLQAALVGSLT